ncbi:hypothetical protein QBC43DRAFT_338876 [Cladorrhinum sp. PSN259]|nr:hypothetical protein QBC43DRAFT_338876 [Cladorrhinum sp. PSN259]
MASAIYLHTCVAVLAHQAAWHRLAPPALPARSSLATSATSSKPSRQPLGPPSTSTKPKSKPILSFSPIMTVASIESSPDDRKPLQAQVNRLNHQVAQQKQWLDGWLEYQGDAEKEIEALRKQLPVPRSIALTIPQIRELYSAPSQQANSQAVNKCRKYSLEGFPSKNALFSHVYSNSCKPASRKDTTPLFYAPPASVAASYLPDRSPLGSATYKKSPSREDTTLLFYAPPAGVAASYLPDRSPLGSATCKKSPSREDTTLLSYATPAGVAGCHALSHLPDSATCKKTLDSETSLASMKPLDSKQSEPTAQNPTTSPSALATSRPLRPYLATPG